MIQRIYEWIMSVLFPPKCILCRSILSDGELDLCHKCRKETNEYPFGFRNPAPNRKSNLHFLDSFTAVWYYGGNVRGSLNRYKFNRKRSYADGYGRLLGMRILQQGPDEIDILTWVPVSGQRKRKRGFDQSEVLAQAVGKEIGLEPIRLLDKIRNTPPQSRIKSASARKANVVGAFKVTAGDNLIGKRILLLDDIFTTGATSEECARALLAAGAKEVHCAAVAAAVRNK